MSNPEDRNCNACPAGKFGIANCELGMYNVLSICHKEYCLMNLDFNTLFGIPVLV